jgi:hypothetical protein
MAAIEVVISVILARIHIGLDLLFVHLVEMLCKANKWKLIVLYWRCLLEGRKEWGVTRKAI